MKFSAAMPVWEIAAKDTSRPVFQTVLVRRVEPYTTLGTEYNAQLVAADGFMLVVVPVVLEASDVEGMVRAELFKLAIKATPRHGEPEMMLDATSVMLKDDSLHYRLPGGKSVTEYGQFPDYHRIVPERPLTAIPLQFGVNPKYLALIGKAVGSPDGVIVTGSPIYGNPLIVDGIFGAKGPPQRTLVAPFGVVMPMGVSVDIVGAPVEPAPARQIKAAAA